MKKLTNRLDGGQGLPSRQRAESSVLLINCGSFREIRTDGALLQDRKTVPYAFCFSHLFNRKNPLLSAFYYLLYANLHDNHGKFGRQIREE